MRLPAVWIVVVALSVTPIGMRAMRSPMTTVALHLRAGRQAPPDIPPGVETIRIPLYDHAIPAPRDYSILLTPTSGPYTKEGHAAYLTAAPIGGVGQWYRSTFAHAGYGVSVVTTRVTGGHPVATNGWVILDCVFASRTRLHVDVELHALAPGHTVISYLALDEVVPRVGPVSGLHVTVAQVVAGSMRNSKAWLGRRVVLRALLIGCVPGANATCSEQPPGLPDLVLEDPTPVGSPQPTDTGAIFLPLLLKTPDDVLDPRFQAAINGPALYEARIVVYALLRHPRPGVPHVAALLIAVHPL